MNDLVAERLVHRTFLIRGKWWEQGRFVSAKFAWLTNAEMTIFFTGTTVSEELAPIFGPAGGRSLRARVPSMAGCGL